jgi:hypothetical protein
VTVCVSNLILQARMSNETEMPFCVMPPVSCCWRKGAVRWAPRDVYPNKFEKSGLWSSGILRCVNGCRRFGETYASTYKTTWHYNPLDHNPSTPSSVCRHVFPWKRVIYVVEKSQTDER